MHSAASSLFLEDLRAGQICAWRNDVIHTGLELPWQNNLDLSKNITKVL